MLSTDKLEYCALSDLCSMLNLSNLISEPTRITETSETLIDVILTSNRDLIKQSNVFHTSISDHFLISCVLNLKIPRSDPPVITTRSYKRFDTEAFCEDIINAPWDTVSIFDHIDDQVSSLNQLFLEILDQHAPIKTFKDKHNKTRVITPEIKELMSKRDYLFRFILISSFKKLARKTKHPSDWEAYRLLRQNVKSQIRLSEKELIGKEIASNRANKTSIWKSVRRCLNPYGSSDQFYSKDPLELANTFNEYFVSVGSTAADLAKQLALHHGLSLLHQL